MKTTFERDKKREGKHKAKRKIFLFVGVIFLIVFLISFISATYTIDNPLVSISSTSAQYGYSGGIGSSLITSNQCSSTQNFILQIDPMGCEDTPVRSDLLADQNVPVLCPIIATKINPLIDVNDLNTISFTGNMPPGVEGMTFIPYRAALYQSTTGLTQSTSGDVGYAVIVLKQQKNESAIPKWINGTVTAEMHYNIQNAFGLGQVNYYLPDTTDSQWAQDYKDYSFWGGRGYLRATGITSNSATISVYSGNNVPNTPGNEKALVSKTTLNVGDTGPKMPISGFSYCMGYMNVKLNGLQNPNTMAKLNVNGETLEVPAGQSFIEGACTVKDISNQGIVSNVDITCPTASSGNVNPTLTISPQVNISVNGAAPTAYSVGDQLPIKNPKDANQFIYIGYIGEDDNGNIFIVPVESTAQTSSAFKQTLLYRSLPDAMKFMSWKSGSVTVNVLKSVIGSVAGGIASTINWGVNGGAPLGIINQSVGGSKSTFTPFYNLPGLLQNLQDSFKSFWTPDSKTFSNEIKLEGLAGPQDIPLSGNSSTYYQNAMKDYQSVIASYSQATYPDGNTVTLGEETMAQEIQFSYDMGQKATAAKLCKQFSDSYPSSQLTPDQCSNLKSFSSTSSSTASVNINGKSYEISLEDVIQPTFKDYGVNVTVTRPGNSPLYLSLTKGEKYYISPPTSTGASSSGSTTTGSSSDYISLEDLTPTSATFDTSGVTAPALQAATSSITAQLNGPSQTFGKAKYSITVTGINLNQLASVTVNPSINLLSTNASFSFNIGIEKRAISLTPNQTKKMINSTTEDIKKLTSVSNKLGTVVTDMQDTCQITGAVLAVKNFIQDLSGTGLARAKVMSGPNGWSQKCADAVKNKRDPVTGEPVSYANVDACLIAHSTDINNAVNIYQNAMTQQDQTYKDIQAQPGVSSNTNVLGETVVDDSKVLSATVTTDAKNTVISEASSSGLTQIKVGGHTESVSQIMDAISPTNIDVATWRDIQLNAGLLGSSDSTVNATAWSALQSDLGTFYANDQAAVQVSQTAKNLNLDPSQIIPAQTTSKTEVVNYPGTTYSSVEKSVTLPGVSPNTPVAAMQANNGLVYYGVLSAAPGGKYIISKLYDSKGSVVYDPLNKKGVSNNGAPTGLISLGLNYQLQVNSYQNQYNNPEMSYYNTGPYAGLPAVLPFDLKHGWYVYIQPTLPTGSSSTIKYYNANGEVSTFDLCNVGSDGIEQGPTGDLCEGINLANDKVSFPGLTVAQTDPLVQCAKAAVESASRQYKSGVSYISISTACGGSIPKLKVGTPSTGTPAIQCEDFMSPSDCNLLFNVCDPVVCPTSRCNLGGAYPVSNVVQTGIVGSLVLCYPNAKWEGGTDYIPVCVTGVKAGLDGYISMLKSFNTCLNTSLQTGQIVGICDEISAIYKCNLFWNDAFPLIKHGAISLLSTVKGEHTSGGGEYLNVQNAVSNAKSMATYFTQSYGAQSYQAFQARSTQNLQTDVCHVYISATIPQASDIMNALSAQSSPPQYTGFFTSSSYTTATNPPTSEYKVYYHIYAGQSYPVQYQVYLKGSGGSYYQDTSPTYVIPGGQGYLVPGQSADATPDFLAPTGYTQLCIEVNGQEDCNFKEVSTNFAVNYLAQLYTANQASQNNITTTAGCSSENGIVRVCASESPGKATDPNDGTTNAIWQPVGYCDTPNMKCWLNKDSVTSTISDQNLAQGALSTAQANVQSYISSNYIQPADFPNIVTAIQSISDPLTQINNITLTLAKVYLPAEKGYLTFLRGGQYGILAEDALLAARSVSNGGSGAPSASPSSVEQCVNVTYTTGSAPVNIPIQTGATPEQYCATLGSTYISSCVPATCSTYTLPTGQTVTATVTSVLPDSVKNAIISSSYSQLQYPVLNLNGIFYFFWNGQWFWSIDKSQWVNSKLSQSQTASAAQNNPLFAQQDATSITTDINLFDQQSSNNQALIKSLVDTSYESGLNLLINFEKQNGGGSLFGLIGKYSLSTNDISMDSNGVFTISQAAAQVYQVSGGTLSFRYASGIWQWSDDGGSSWVNVLDTQLQGMPSQQMQNIVQKLSGETEAVGAQILFSIGSAGTSTSSSSGTATTGFSCSAQSDCQKELGDEILNVAQQIESQLPNVPYSNIQQDTGVKNFGCLALLVANVESNIQQCKLVQQNNNPLYCDGNSGEVLGGDLSQGGSMGVMQINTVEHPGAFSNANPNNAYNFEYNINYGIKLLASSYITGPKTYVCYLPSALDNGGTISDSEFESVSYSGWNATLRNYNGWNTQCTTTSTGKQEVLGNPHYVDDILSKQNENEVYTLFPQCA